MLLSSLSESTNGFLQFLTVLIIFIFVVGITLFTTRWMANYQKGKSIGANIEVIETFRITANKYIQIIRTGEKYLAVAIGKDEVTFLTELDKEQIDLAEKPDDAVLDFGSILEKVKNLKK